MEKIYNAIILLLLFATAAMGCLLYLKWIGVREENIERRLDESRLVYQLGRLSEEKAYKEEYYHRLLHDEAFAERVIREKLGFVGKNEVVFRFKDSTPVSVDTRFAPRFFPKSSNAGRDEPEPVTLEEKTDGDGSAEKKSFLRRIFSGSHGDVDGSGAGVKAEDSKSGQSVGGASGVKIGVENSALRPIEPFKSGGEASAGDSAFIRSVPPEAGGAGAESAPSAQNAGSRVEPPEKNKPSPNAIRFRAN